MGQEERTSLGIHKMADRKSSRKSIKKRTGGSKRLPYSRKKCPKGSVFRRGFSFYSNRVGRTVKVKSSCIKSKGSLRSRGKKPIRAIPPLHAGTLTQFGFRVKETEAARHQALKKAAKSLGSSEVIRKLNALRVLTRNTRPEQSRISDKGMRYVQGL